MAQETSFDMGKEFAGNESFDRQEIIRTHREATKRRMAEYGGTILAVQNTTGIGYISDKTRGSTSIAVWR
jgi:hypothetical protein